MSDHCVAKYTTILHKCYCICHCPTGSEHNRRLCFLLDVAFCFVCLPLCFIIYCYHSVNVSLSDGLDEINVNILKYFLTS